MGNGIVGALSALFILVLLFAIFRAFVLWYWRVGEIVTLLKSIDEKLGRAASPRV